MAKVNALKTGKAGGPPPEDAAPGNTAIAPRGKDQPVSKMQFSVPEGLLDEFSMEAGKEFGFKKGAKSLLFMKIWEHYQATK
ncbi:MAG: hypothetical protein COA43_16555 [Robiginitomaculum sp.]|nr:MAG: hypothetical protein COA43_16555 [Robiginitomaculum sp.]